MFFSKRQSRSFKLLILSSRTETILLLVYVLLYPVSLNAEG